MTYGTLRGAPERSAGRRDVFIARYSASGTRAWLHQFGSKAIDEPTSIAIGGDGALFVYGDTLGRLPGAPEPDGLGGDAFLARFTPSGQLVWVHQLGGEHGVGAGGLELDGAGDLYLDGFAGGAMAGSPDPFAGGDGDVFVARFSAAGERAWVHLLGSPEQDAAEGIRIGADGNLSIAGYTHGTIAGSPVAHAGDIDAFVARYAPSGERLWVQDFGSSAYEFPIGPAVDVHGNTYVTGFTASAVPGAPEPPAGSMDGFLVKFSPTGRRLWVHQLSGNDDDRPWTLAVDDTGNVYLAGNSSSTDLSATDPNAGGSDALVVKYSPSGERLWVHLLGSTESEQASAIALDERGRVLIAGDTWGTLLGSPERNSGEGDMFVASYPMGG